MIITEAGARDGAGACASLPAPRGAAGEEQQVHTIPADAHPATGRGGASRTGEATQPLAEATAARASTASAAGERMMLAGTSTASVASERMMSAGTSAASAAGERMMAANT